MHVFHALAESLDRGAEVARLRVDARHSALERGQVEDLVHDVADLLKEMEAEEARERAERERVRREKLQGVLEMAGAVCHELNQPVMAITGYADIIAMRAGQNDPLQDKVSKLKKQALRVGTITHKLMQITKYRTKDYGKGEKIIDIEAAAGKNAE